jgi:hypothetical protein
MVAGNGYTPGRPPQSSSIALVFAGNQKPEACQLIQRTRYKYGMAWHSNEARDFQPAYNKLI